MACIILVSVAAPCFGASSLDRYPALMDTLMAGDYAAANQICSLIEVDHPGHPAAIYGQACVLYAHVSDFEDSTGRARFFSLCDSCFRVCDSMKDVGADERATLSYLRGGALSAKALMAHREGGTLRGLRLLMKARREFQKAIDADSTFYDAYLGRGAYRYGAATNASLISWLPWMPSAESGWRDLWLAADSSRFSKYSALSALVWFVIQKQDYALADSICNVGLARFPECRNFMWPRLAVRMKQKQWRPAEDAAKNLLAQYLSHPDNNGYDATGLYVTLMTCADSLGRPEVAIQYAQAGLTTFRKPDVAARRKEKLKLLEERLARTGGTDREVK